MSKTPKGSTLDFFQKTFFPQFEWLNPGCGLSAGAAYLRVFTVIRVYIIIMNIRCIIQLNLKTFCSDTSKIQDKAQILSYVKFSWHG